MRPGGVALLCAYVKFDLGGERAGGGRVDVRQDRITFGGTRTAELLQHTGIAGLAGAIVAVDDG